MKKKKNVLYLIEKYANIYKMKILMTNLLHTMLHIHQSPNIQSECRGTKEMKM